MQHEARLGRLQAITDAALAHLALDDLLEELLTRIRDFMAADTAAILLLDESGSRLAVRAAKGLEEAVERGVVIPVGRGFAGRVAAERRPVVIEEAEHAEILNPVLREKGVRSLLGVPLLVEGRVLGVLHVGTLVRRGFTAEEQELLQAAGDRAALGIEHARLYEAEHAAREEAERRAPAAAALAYVADGVVLLDVEGRIRFWNPAAAAITGVEAELALDRPVGEVISGWTSVMELVPVAPAPAVTRAETVPLEIEGREVWLSMTGVGFPDGTVYAFRDVTEEQRLEEWQSEFIATISHEFRTPMASIYGAAHTLRRRDVELGEETREAMLAIIYDEADRLARLVENILVASRIQAKRFDVAPTSVDVGSLAAGVIAALETHVPGDVRLELEVPEDPPAVVADADKVSHVLRNLIENAIKYSPAGGRIVVRLDRQERHLRVAVQDEGLGIPPHERAHIFERFYRVREHARKGIAGTGLGLYIARELVQRMQGRIWVSSRVGGGSTFYVELPLADASP